MLSVKKQAVENEGELVYFGLKEALYDITTTLLKKLNLINVDDFKGKIREFQDFGSNKQYELKKLDDRLESLEKSRERNSEEIEELQKAKASVKAGAGEEAITHILRKLFLLRPYITGEMQYLFMKLYGDIIKIELELGKELVNDKIFSHSGIPIAAIEYAILESDECLVEKILNCKAFNKQIDPYIFNESETVFIDCFKELYSNKNFRLLNLILEAPVKINGVNFFTPQLQSDSLLSCVIRNCPDSALAKKIIDKNILDYFLFNRTLLNLMENKHNLSFKSVFYNTMLVVREYFKSYTLSFFLFP